MPESGRPTKGALLKMTKGCACPARKPFQKVLIATGAGSVSTVERASETRCGRIRSMPTARKVASPIEHTTSTAIQRKEKGRVDFASCAGSRAGDVWSLEATGGRSLNVSA